MNHKGLPEGIGEFAVRAISQLFSFLTGGWLNPWRSPRWLPFLSASARAGRGRDLGAYPWVWMAPLIDWAFWQWRGEPDHCARSWRGYKRRRGIV